MASQAAFPQSVANDSSSGVSWGNPGNAVGPADGAFAIASPGSLQTSKRLVSTSCGLTVPPGATILGIEVSLYIESGGTNGVNYDVSLWRAGSLDGSTTKTIGGSAIPSSLTLLTFGSPTDLWGASWSAADVNDAGFGFGYRCENDDSTGLRFIPDISVDYTQVTVYYSGGTPPSFSAAGASSAIFVPSAPAVQPFTATGAASATFIPSALGLVGLSADGSASALFRPNPPALTASGTASASFVATAHRQAAMMADGEAAALFLPFPPALIAAAGAAVSFDPWPPTFSAAGSASADFVATSPGGSGASSSLLRGMPGCCACGTSPPRVTVFCGFDRVPIHIPATLNLTVPPGPVAFGAEPVCFTYSCWVVLSLRQVCPGGGAVFCFVSADPSGPYIYGPPPAAVASAFPAGFNAWWNPVPMVNRSDPGCGGSFDSIIYNYLNWVAPFGGACQLHPASAELSDGVVSLSGSVLGFNMLSQTPFLAMLTTGSGRGGDPFCTNTLTG